MRRGVSLPKYCWSIIIAGARKHVPGTQRSPIKLHVRCGLAFGYAENSLHRIYHPLRALHVARSAPAASDYVPAPRLRVELGIKGNYSVDTAHGIPVRRAIS